MLKFILCMENYSVFDLLAFVAQSFCPEEDIPIPENAS